MQLDPQALEAAFANSDGTPQGYITAYLSALSAAEWPVVEAAKALLADWDERRGTSGPERFVSDDLQGEPVQYWSPDASMVSSKAIAGLRLALAAPPAGDDWVEWNINYATKLKPTVEGWEMLRAQYAEAARPKADADGWVQMQGWEVMQIFGPHVSLGRSVPFETTVRVWFPLALAARP